MVFTNTIYKFPDETYMPFYETELNISNLSYKILSTDTRGVNYEPPVDRIIWIKFTKASTKKLKNEIVAKGIRIKGLVDITEIEWDFYNDELNDKQLYNLITEQVTIGVQNAKQEHRS